MRERDRERDLAGYSLSLFTPVCRMRVKKADEGILFHEDLNQNIRKYSSFHAMWKKKTLRNRIRSLSLSVLIIPTKSP